MHCVREEAGPGVVFVSFASASGSEEYRTVRRADAFNVLANLDSSAKFVKPDEFYFQVACTDGLLVLTNRGIGLGDKNAL